MNSGVAPSFSGRSTLAPLRSSSSTTAKKPFSTAAKSAVEPLPFCKSILAPCRKSSSTCFGLLL
eukprot:CAMPEP_0198308100 /NCGR_PEP_ID=MMETSP1450-20131203/874_1 /TAXON_ID=753684 ORGANISM="Madagascaria erythrocladiodes, Strain CCMP3234" /NCGR_SAMPLE_ID=MMETSP1450 /ASSEMBLY_ACC=CAM_ASM_001115 /LENGTH=63 /DNA_ID=CAMNT_0044010739 /DNA_START=18 /DNA_END=209 /DNA_ORIENTATION=-